MDANEYGALTEEMRQAYQNYNPAGTRAEARALLTLAAEKPWPPAPARCRAARLHRGDPGGRKNGDVASNLAMARAQPLKGPARSPRPFWPTCRPWKTAFFKGRDRRPGFINLFLSPPGSPAWCTAPP